MLKNILLVAVGGAVGSIFRYAASLIALTKKFPAATFMVNILGSFLIGLLMGYLAKQIQQQNWQLLLVTGFCGGFTTFSAFSWDDVLLLQQQRYITAIIYIAATIALGVLCTVLGYWISN